MELRTDSPPVAIAAEAHVGTQHSDDIRSANEDAGVFLVLDVTAVPPAAREAKEEETEKEKEELAAEKAAVEGTLKLIVEAKDEVSGKYVPITAFAATKKASEFEEGTFAFTVYPSAAETAAVANHEVMALPVPRHWRVTVEHSKADGSWDYSVGYQPLGA